MGWWEVALPVLTGTGRSLNQHCPNKIGRCRPYTGPFSISETGTGRAPAGTAKKLPNNPGTAPKPFVLRLRAGN
jgi:hypothetical protein